MEDIESLRRILGQSRTIAVVGLSADWFRPSYFAAKYMQEHGYTLLPVNPRYPEILGETCYPTLTEAREKSGLAIDIVDVFRKASDVPPIAEIQVALQEAVVRVTGLKGSELKTRMRTGTVASTDNRNWELLPHPGPERRFSQSRAVALDMESATIAANGFRFRVPYGTLLCVSDKPLHGEIKLPGMANHFYRERVDQHLRIGMRALTLLRDQGLDVLHSRKLRSFDEVAFQ